MSAFVRKLGGSDASGFGCFFPFWMEESVLPIRPLHSSILAMGQAPNSSEIET